MKKIYIIITQVIFILTFLFIFTKIIGQVHGVENKVWNEIVDVLNKETKSYDSYVLFTEGIKNLDINSLIAEYNNKSILWKSSFQEGKFVYEKYSSSSDEQLREVTITALNASNKSLEAIEQYDKAFSGELSKEELNTTFDLGDSLIIEASKEHYKAVDLYNNYSGFNSHQNLLYTLYICIALSAIFTVILWFKSRTSSHYQSDIIKAQIFKSLLGSSMWLFGGLALTTYSYSYVSKEGGTYYILYGPILIGAWQMLKGLWIYFTKDRKTLEQLKSKDKTDLLTKFIKGD